MKYDNDNEHLPFITLSAATRNALRFLRLDDHVPDRDANREQDNRTDQQKKEEEAESIRQRIRDIEAFERRAKGLNRLRRKRN
jgi:translation initiation factor 2B subunit (eIF-2B alpha/beta/delta family)